MAYSYELNAALSYQVEPEESAAYSQNYFYEETDDQSSSEENSSNNEPDTRNWNEEYQTIMESKEKDKYLKLAGLSKDFASVAENLAKIIISERYLSDVTKLIKPVSVGGCAGGTKYIAKGILFKFVTDVILPNKSFLYGGNTRNDANAIKAAGHELKGLTTCLQLISYLNLPINVPLMCLVDYRGFRLIAVSILPISSKTIIYGSSDGGKTVHTDDSAFNQYCSTLFSAMNLKEHVINDKLMNGPGDIEGHFGTDKKYYLLDYARVLPPEKPITPENSRSIFYHSLRYELIIENSSPLCSDAFSGWIRNDPNITNHNEEVIKASNQLYETKIPYLAKKLNERKDIDLVKSNEIIFKTILHENGINMRHLAILLKDITIDNWKVLIRTEMVARAIRKVIQEKLRKTSETIRDSSEQPYIMVVVDYIKEIFFIENDSFTLPFWRKNIKKILNEKYSHKCSALSEVEMNEDYDYINSIYLIRMFERLEDLLSITFSERVKALLPALDSQRGERYLCPIINLATSLSIFDISHLSTKTKQIPLIDLAQGNALYSQVLKQETDCFQASPSYILLDEATRYVQAANYANPKNVDLRYKLANLIYIKSKKNGVPDRPTLQRIQKILQDSLAIEPKHSDSHYLLGFILCHLDLVKEAQKSFSQALMSNPLLKQVYLNDAIRVINNWQYTGNTEVPAIANATLGAIIENDPNFGLAYYWLTELHLNYYDRRNYNIISKAYGDEDIIKLASESITIAVKIDLNYFKILIANSTLCNFHKKGCVPIATLIILAKNNELLKKELKQFTEPVEILNTSQFTRWSGSTNDYFTLIDDWGEYFPNLTTFSNINAHQRLPAETYETLCKHCPKLSNLELAMSNAKVGEFPEKLFLKKYSLTSVTLNQVPWSPSLSLAIGRLPLQTLKLIEIYDLTDEHIKTLLENNKGTIRIFHIQNCGSNLGIEALSHIADHCSLVEELLLFGYFMDSHFSKLLNSCKNIKTLSLGCPKFSSSCFLSFKDALPKLEYLSLKEFTEDSLQHFHELGNSLFASNLKAFNLRDMRLRLEHFEKISQKFLSLETLRLELCGYLNNEKMGEMIAQFVNLKELLIYSNGGNWMTDSAIAKIAKSCVKLNKLVLSDRSALKTDALNSLMTNCPNLTYLNISFQRDLPKDWSNLLVKNNKLKYLNINGCPTSTKTLSHIVDSQPDLEELTMEGLFFPEYELVKLKNLKNLKQLTCTLMKGQSLFVLLGIVKGLPKLVYLRTPFTNLSTLMISELESVKNNLTIVLQ